MPTTVITIYILAIVSLLFIAKFAKKKLLPTLVFVAPLTLLSKALLAPVSGESIVGGGVHEFFVGPALVVIVIGFFVGFKKITSYFKVMEGVGRAQSTPKKDEPVDAKYEEVKK